MVWAVFSTLQAAKPQCEPERATPFTVNVCFREQRGRSGVVKLLGVCFGCFFFSLSLCASFPVSQRSVIGFTVLPPKGEVF